MANDYYGGHMDDGFNMWGEKTESNRESVEMGRSGDPRKRDMRIVQIGEKVQRNLEAATHYRSAAGRLLRIVSKDPCSVCGKALTVHCPEGVFVDFYTLHVKCNRAYYEEHGCPPKGVGMMFVGEGDDQVVAFGRVEMMHQMMEATPPEMLGEVRHSFD